MCMGYMHWNLLLIWSYSMKSSSANSARFNLLIIAKSILLNIYLKGVLWKYRNEDSFLSNCVLAHNKDKLYTNPHFSRGIRWLQSLICLVFSYMSDAIYYMCNSISKYVLSSNVNCNNSFTVAGTVTVPIPLNLCNWHFLQVHSSCLPRSWPVVFNSLSYEVVLL